MSQRYDQDLILAYVEDELDDAAKYRFERQLQQDARLQTLVQQLSDDRRQLRSLAAEPAPAGLMDRAQGFLERQMLLGDAASQPAEQAARNRHRLVCWTTWSGVAALLLVGAGTLFLIFAETRSFQTVITRVTSQNNEARPSAAPRTPELADATAKDATTASDAQELARVKDAEPASAGALAEADNAGAVPAATQSLAIAQAPSTQEHVKAFSLTAGEHALGPAAPTAAAATTQNAPVKPTPDWPRQLWRSPLEESVAPLAPRQPAEIPLQRAP